MTTRKNIITLAGGGSTLAPNIVRGGKAIDLGNNFYYIKGRKHKNGGVDVGENAKTGLEVEGEEVMQVKPNEVRVFSSVPFLRGVSPAELVMNGNNPDAVFNAQERFKDINKINDDGTKAKYGIEKSDNINIAKPIVQEFIPATGVTKFIQEYQKRNSQAKGNIKIVSPEFDLLTGVRGLTNMIIKDIPITKGSYYRVVGKDAIDDAKQIDIIRTPTEPKFDVQTLNRLSEDLKIPFKDIKNKSVNEIRELIRKSDLPPAKKLIRTKSNHGDVGFSKEGFFYKPNKNNYVIEGTENSSTFLQGHHGNYSGRFNKDINTGEPVVLREGENASNFTYWQHHPIIGWRNHKFSYGGNMIASINGNIKNGLIHTEMKYDGRRKAKYGSYDNMLGLGRANYITNVEKDRQFREILNLTPNLPNDLTEVDIENIKKKPKTLKAVVRNGKPTVDPIDVFLTEHPNIDKTIKLASDILSSWITLGSGMKGIKPIITKSNISTKQIGNTSKNISYKKPNYPATIKKQKINNPYKTTKTPKEDIIENINIPEQLKLPDSKALYENAVRVGRKQSTMSKSTSRELDKIYNKVVGNKPPRSGFEFKYQPTEIPYSPSTNDIGRIYDAAAEWNKYFGKRLYKDYVKKYGKKGVDKALKKEGISVYKYGGRKKADLGISYFAPSLFGPKYDKIVDLNSDGTRSERSLLYADATNPNRSFTDILLNGELDNYSGMGNFSNRRIEGYRNITPSIETPAVTPVATKATTSTVSTTSATPAVSKTSSVSSPVKELIDAGDYTPDYSNDKLEAIKYDAPKNQLISKLENDLFKPIQSSDTKDKWWNGDNLDKINLYTNLGASAADFITSTILNSQLPTYSLPTMTAPSLSALPEIKLADIKEIEAPKTVAAAKLKTRYNANPQLSKIEDETRRTIDDIDRNTADSRVALARKQRARIASQEAKNQVYGQKENIETDLINKDKLNAQAVAQSNATAYNNYLAAKAQQAMGKAQLQMMVDKANIGNKLAVNQFNANAKLIADRFNTNNKIKEILGNNAIETTKLNNYAQGVSNLLSNIGGSIDNYTTNKMSRKRDAEKLRAIETLAPNIPNELKQYILKGLI